MTLPPHSVEAEQAVIGGLILSGATFDLVHWLKPDDFYRADHRTIYSTVREIIEAGKPCDVLLLAQTLEARGVLAQCGGQGYLGEMAANVPSPANISSYAKLVQRHARSRALQALATDLHAAAGDTSHDPLKVAETVADRALQILDVQSTSDIVHMKQAVGEAVDWLEDPVKGISTGYSALDAIFTLRPGELVIIAGRPSMGKSALSHNIAEHVASVDGQHVAFFTLEMSRRQIGARSLRWHTHLEGLNDAVKRLFGYNLWIDDSPNATIGSLRVRMQRLLRKSGLSLVVVDYLQLASGQGDNRTQEIGSISRGLKALAKEFGVPIIACSQLNRGVEARQDKRPMLSDLRESGEVEQDADVVAFLYRDEYYNEDSYAKGFAEVIVRKQRDGATGTAWLLFVPEYARFRDFSGVPPKAHETARAPSTGTVRSMDWGKKRSGDDA